MVRKAIPIGIEFYKEMIDKDYYYVDKTWMIKDILDNKGKVNLFTRPRRFGKTLTQTMLKAFFEQEIDTEGNVVDNRRYFEGKRIMEAGEEYLSHMGQYPVIFLTLKSAKQPNYKLAYEVLLGDIRREFTRHRYVLQDDILTDEQRRQFERILADDVAEADCAVAFKILSECLYAYHKKNVIILLDEYDVPLENAYFSGFYDEMVGFIRSLFESSLKTNNYLEFAVITGCLRISKESIFTGLNNLNVVSIISNNYAEYFGFVQQEVEEMLSYYGMSDRIAEAKQWYDGYLFGETEVYNPWSIINYVNGITDGGIPYPRPFWANTSSNSIVRELIAKADVTVKKEIESLMDFGTIEKPIHEDITYGEIDKTQDNLWNFLFFTGYLKAVSVRFEGINVYLTLAIPNMEILYIYENSIKDWFREQVKVTDFSKMYEAVLSGDARTFQENIVAQLRRSISYYDTVEQFYHGFMLGILSPLKDYRVLSNREGGNGRTDITLTPVDLKMPAVILEFKCAKKLTELEAGCDEALKQIDDRNYMDEPVEEGCTHIIKYGICFYKKICKVKCKEETVEFLY